MIRSWTSRICLFSLNRLFEVWSKNENQTREILYISDHFFLEHYSLWGAIEEKIHTRFFSCLISSNSFFSGVIECLKITTEPNCARIAKFAFDYATKHGRKKVSKLRFLFVESSWIQIINLMRDDWWRTSWSCRSLACTRPILWSSETDYSFKSARMWVSFPPYYYFLNELPWRKKINIISDGKALSAYRIRSDDHWQHLHAIGECSWTIRCDGHA